MDIGVYSFGELQPPLDDHAGITPHRRLRDLLEEIRLADEVGLDVFGIGEHHRPDYAVSAPAVVLAAAAARTKRIHLTSAVTVLSTDDPVRVFQDFATLDLLSSGRAELMVGRGSFTESFALFGHDLSDYDDLFAEKLALLLEISRSERPKWQGRFRASIEGVGIYPRPFQERLPIWVAVGGQPASAHRAGAMGLPMALAIIGGMPERFAPLAQVHRAAAEEAGHDPLPRLSINSLGYIADTSQKALDESFPAFSTAMNRIGRERGWAPLTRTGYEVGATLRGAHFVGSPQQVIDKILFQHQVFRHDRLLLQLSLGTLPHQKVMRSLELLGTEVAPVVKRESSQSQEWIEQREPGRIGEDQSNQDASKQAPSALPHDPSTSEVKACLDASQKEER